MLHPDHFDMTKVQQNIMKKVCKFELRLQAFGFPPLDPSTEYVWHIPVTHTLTKDLGPFPYQSAHRK